MNERRYSLRKRIVLIIIGSVVATSLIFGVTTLGIVYATEDHVFNEALSDEVSHQKDVWQRTDRLSGARNPDVRIYRSGERLPDEIRREVRENPVQTEFSGKEGRHYHVLRIDLNEGRNGAAAEPATAVMEVSDELLVRPYRDAIVAFLIAASLIVAILMASLGWWIANRAMRPLSDLAASVTESGLNLPVVHASNFPENEIRTLAEALEQSFGRISAFIERERNFTRDASHELRTPLAVVRGAVEVMRINPDLPPTLSEPIRRIESATTDMLLALDQLLSLARESADINKEFLPIRPMVDKAVSWAKIRYPNSAISVSVEVPPTACALVNRVSLQLVLNNLIGNCFQHVVVGELTIDFEDDNLTISDNGPGLPSDASTTVARASQKRDTSSGFGLEITRRLCDAMGIEMTAQNIAGNGGAYFNLHIPQT